VAEIERKADSWRKTPPAGDLYTDPGILADARKSPPSMAMPRCPVWAARREGRSAARNRHPFNDAEDRIFERELKEHREGLEAAKINRSKNRPPT
jgi:hypothetical protein